MKILRKPKKDLNQWHRWFAWKPVLVENHWVWLETIERQCLFIPHYDGVDVIYSYRFIETRGNDEVD